jgi:hypothetical protein
LPLRAREATRIGRGCAEQSDLLEPAGRCRGCWQTSPFLFSGSCLQIPVRGAMMEFGRSVLLLMWRRCANGPGGAELLSYAIEAEAAPEQQTA